MTFEQLLRETEDEAYEKGFKIGYREGVLIAVVEKMLKRFSVKEIAAILEESESTIQKIVDKI